MKAHKPKILLSLIIVLIVLAGCYPNTEVTMVRKEAIRAPMLIESASKAYLVDGSVVLLPEGFDVHNDCVRGLAQRYWISHEDSHPWTQEIPLDSIAVMTYYDKKISDGRALASFMLGLFGTVMTPLSIYCVSCPKCCFGSCPTVYTYHQGVGYNLVAELFSHSISRLLEEADLDLLEQTAPEEGDYCLRITNEALETHFINRLSLLAVYHPLGSTILPTSSGTFVSVGKTLPADEAFNRQGKSVLDLVGSEDGVSYTSDTSAVLRLRQGVYSDWVSLKVNVPEQSRSMKMVLRLRNSLLSTVLFYDLVLASQGLHALEWTERMNADPVYAAQFQAVYKMFSGISVDVLGGGAWTQQDYICDVGPIAWKTICVDIPVNSIGKLSVRLRFVPGNLMIDYVGFDVMDGRTPDLIVQEIPPKEVRDYAGKTRDDIPQLVALDDEQYLVTNPGESYRFSYNIPQKKGAQVTTFIRSKGYYTEWIRGSWLRTQETGYRFDLNQINETLAELAQRWLENKDFLEKTFFETRIRLKERP